MLGVVLWGCMELGNKRALVGTATAFTLELALQLSGYQSPLLAFIFALIGMGCVGYLVWPYLMPTWKKISRRQRPSIEEGREESLDIVLQDLPQSEWGEWQKAQGSVVGPEQMEMWFWASELTQKAATGQLGVRATRSDSITREDLPKDFWRVAYLDAEPDPARIWKVKIKPRDGVSEAQRREILEADYGGLTASLSNVRELWPKAPPLDSQNKSLLWASAVPIAVLMSLAIPMAYHDLRPLLASLRSTAEEVPKGSVAFKGLRVEVFKNKTTGEADVQIGFVMENTNDVLVAYEVKSIYAEINSRTAVDPKNPNMLSMGGYIYPRKTAIFRYEKIKHVDLTRMPVAGLLEFDLRYGVNLATSPRKSYKKAQFTLFTVPQADVPVIFLSEIEE